MNRPACALLLALCACGNHTVTVFAPSADVPAGTEVVAAVTPGDVKQFEPGTTVSKPGVLMHKEHLVANVAPTDLLVVRAGGGDAFGAIHVVRKPIWEAVSLLGILVVVGGTIASVGGAGACLSSGAGGPAPGFSNAGCLGLGGLGLLVAWGAGVPIVAWGVHGELTVYETPHAKPAVSFTLGPNGIAGTF